MAKFLDQNGLLYFWQKIVNKFVAKETGKGLSTNDYTTTDKEKLGNLANIKQIGEGLELDPTTGILKSTGGGTADSVDWPDVENTPTTLEGYGITDAAKSDHNHDTSYLKLSGGTMTGPIVFSDDQGQIKVDGTAAEAKVEIDTAAAEILYKSKTDNKTNRMTVSADGAEIVVGENGNSKDGMIKIFDSGIVQIRVGAQTALEISANGLNVLDKKIDHVATPTDDDQATNKGYVDTAVSVKANAADVYQKTETYSKTELDSKLSAVYKPGGTVYFENLPEPSATTLGFVYNLGNAFITDDRFLASTPVPYPIGTDVVVVAVPGDPITYKFDVLAGFVDLSGYWKKSDLVAVTNSEIDEIVTPTT